MLDRRCASFTHPHFSMQIFFLHRSRPSIANILQLSLPLDRSSNERKMIAVRFDAHADLLELSNISKSIALIRWHADFSREIGGRSTRRDASNFPLAASKVENNGVTKSTRWRGSTSEKRGGAFTREQSKKGEGRLWTGRGGRGSSVFIEARKSSSVRKPGTKALRATINIDQLICTTI